MEGKYIELNTFLKIKLLIATGGQAKVLISSGAVKLNGEVETRNKKKLVAGDKVKVDNKEFIVDEDILK